MTSDELLKLAGFRPEMREAAREAARRQGLSLDDWLQQLVLSATEAPKEQSMRTPKRARRARSEPRTSEAERSMQAISSRLEALTEKIADLSHAKASPQVRSEDSLSDTLSAIEERIAAMGPTSPPVSPAGYTTAPRRSRQRTREASYDFDDLALQVRNDLGTQADDDFSAQFDQDFERQIAEIAARQQALEDQSEPLKDQFLALSRRLDQAPPAETRDLRDQMMELTQELQAVRATGGFENAVNALRRELSEISRKLGEAAPRHAVQALESEVRALATRIDDGRNAGGDPAALAGIEAGLAQVYEALRHMAPAESLAAFRDEIRKLDDKIENLAAREPDSSTTSAVLRQLERAIIDLGTIASRAASGDALVALAEEVQDISSRTDRILADSTHRETTFSSMIEQRFEELARHLDGRQQSSIATTQTQIHSVVSALADKLERSDLGGVDSSALNTITEQLDHITQRLETSDSRLNEFGQFERSFADLAGRMDALHNNAISVAKSAASAAPSHQELDLLRNDIGTLQHNQVLSDQRTQETLASVHQTLAKLVDRLATADTRAAEPRAYSEPRPYAEARHQAVPAFEAPPVSASPLGATTEPASETVPNAERPLIDPTLPADYPLEPGTAAPVRPASALDRPLTPADNSKSNFIAAARRAAQAAMQATEPPPASESKPSTLGALARKFTGRNAVMLAALLVASLGVFHLVFNQPAPQPLMDVKKVTTAAIRPPEQRPPVATAASRSTPAPVASTASINPPAQPSGGAPLSAAKAELAKSYEMPAVSPLTIASIQLPAANDLTATVSRATGLSGGAPSASQTAPADLVSTFPQGLRTAAMTGNGAAEYEVGVRFAEGRGVAQNYQEAARWLERSANRNLAPAQYRLGSLYEKGNGVKKDLDQARRLYRAAADAGNGKAMHNLAVLYAEGIEDRPDFKSAIEWFRKAANFGIPDSQYNVAILYARGLGTEINLAESYKWFSLAAQQGDEDAGKKRDDVAGRMDASQLTAAQRAVQSFRPAQQPEAAVMVAPPSGGWDSATESAPKPKSGFGRKRAQT